ncbi:MAG TPA: aspartate dehydrogenase [Alphaproteobacteria bacterium]|nr:aspartate dehydrogenase [Alphaproteobacteria bacterium]
MRRFKVGLIGAGAIGRDVVALLRRNLEKSVEVPIVLARSARPSQDPPVTDDIEAFLDHQLDAVIEGAGHAALITHGERILDAGADLVVTSSGAFAADSALLERLAKAAQRNFRKVLLASAGIGAVDILAGAAEGGLDRVTITVRKDPSAWYGTPAEQKVDLARLNEPSIVFNGSVREGAALYPKNVNISATVALAGIGLDRTHLVIVADPAIASHIVEVEAEGVFGKFRFVEDVAISESNPKTGKLVAMAVVKTIRNLARPVVIGA